MVQRILCLLILVVLAAPASADVIATYNKTTVNDAGKLGQMTGQQLVYEGYDGTIGFFNVNATYNNQFGVQLPGYSTVESFSIDQYNSGGRPRIKDVTVYYGVGQSADFTLTDSQAPLTLAFASPVSTDYLHVQCKTFYPAGDPNLGLMEIIANGTVGPPRTNLNREPGVTVSGTGYGYNPITLLNDGTVRPSMSNAPFWNRSGNNPDTLRVDYDVAKTVGEIGIALSLDNLREQPKSFILNYTGGSEVFSLADGMQYARYALAAPVDTMFLEVVFPTGTGDFYNVGSDGNYGVTEFQAFEPLPSANGGGIPEPAALGLLGLALLAVKRRRS